MIFINQAKQNVRNLFFGVNEFKLIWFLMLLYTIVILTANWYNARIVEFFGIATDAGTIIFPITFIVSNLITEVYGYKYARKAIWFGFLFNIAFLLYGFAITNFESPDYAQQQNAMFDSIFAINIWIILGSFVSYWSSEPTNSYIMAKLKIVMNGKFMWVRFVASTVIASFIDSVIFTHIAFISLFDYVTIWSLIIVMWFIKIGIEIVGLTISLPTTRKLKKFEGFDRYDIGTNFAIFSTDCRYLKDTNKYGK